MVTGSCYKLTSDRGAELLIDQGLFQGVAKETAWNKEPLQYNPASLAGVVLTHAHLDHCGRLPLLAKYGFREKIFMTKPTQELINLSLHDSAKIASENPLTALYDDSDVVELMNQTEIINYHEKFKIGDFVINYINAGHLLGSASIEISDSSSKIVMSGDLGNTPQFIIPPTEFIDSADFVVMESTYGDKNHPDEKPIEIIADEINTVEHTGGTLLIPAFALERTQDILLLIGELKKLGKVKPKTPIFLDSPMATRATEIYFDYPDYFNEETRAQFKHENPFNFDGLEVVENFKFSSRIKKIKGPKVIIAGSGMMTGGRILSQAKEFLPKKTTRLLFVGYQGEETMGREILEGAGSVQIDKRYVPIRAHINETHTLSSHADQQRLLNWLGHIKGVQKLFLTHGDESPRQILSEKIRSEFQIPHVLLPSMNEEIIF